MNDYQIAFTSRAKDDIINIGDYITFTLLEPDTSKNFITGLKDSISQLKYFPYKFPLIPDNTLQMQNIRYMPYKNYYVFYTIIDILQIVIILRLGHKRRKWTDILT